MAFSRAFLTLKPITIHNSPRPSLPTTNTIHVPSHLSFSPSMSISTSAISSLIGPGPRPGPGPEPGDINCPLLFTNMKHSGWLHCAISPQIQRLILIFSVPGVAHLCDISYTFEDEEEKNSNNDTLLITGFAFSSSFDNIINVNNGPPRIFKIRINSPWDDQFDRAGIHFMLDHGLLYVGIKCLSFDFPCCYVMGSHSGIRLWMGGLEDADAIDDAHPV